MKSEKMKPLFQLIEGGLLNAHPQNPRLHSGSEKLSESVERFGFYGAVIVQSSTMRILAGHARTRLLRESDTKVPCILLDVDDDAALKILLADNRTSDLAERDCAELLAILEPLADTSGTGYSVGEVNALRAAIDLPSGDWFDQEELSGDEFDPKIRFSVCEDDYVRFTRILADQGGSSVSENLASLLEIFLSVRN